MHLILPYANAPNPEARKLRPKLPHLSKLLGRMVAAGSHGFGEHSLNTPLEWAVAERLGWQGADGCLPWAAHAAHQDGVNVGTLAWGQLTPVHWLVGNQHISLLDPAHLHLSAENSHHLFQAMRPLFEREGWQVAWGAPTRWYAAHESLEQLPCACIDRAIGRNIDAWVPTHAQAQDFRRIQNEVQMMLYRHPINDERAQKGALPINSIWLSGCGRLQSTTAAEPAVEVHIDTRLRMPYLAGDGAAWSETWSTIDATILSQTLAQFKGAEPFMLTLAGESQARSFAYGKASRWSRLNPFSSQLAAHTILATL
jgi:hypothetical protein